MTNTQENEFEFATLSRRGDRKENQDCAEQYVDEKQAVFIVADGLGGHKNGRFAARYFCERFIHHTSKHQKVLYTDPVHILNELFDLAEFDLNKALESYPDGMEARTTCVVAYSSDKLTLSLHVGDSRFYLADQDTIIWRSKDHSIVQILVDQKEITEQEAETHPDRNRIYKCLGGEIKQKAVIKELPALSPSQLILICSDGFWHTLDHARLAKLITASDLALQLQSLVQQAIEDANGRSDNVTATVLRKPLKF